MNQEKITFTHEKETLLVPLYGKALEGRRATPVLVDPMAEDILARIDYDFAELRVPPQTRVTLVMRAKKLDACVRDYLAAHDTALVLHLGCGLDSRVARAGDPRASWYDLDFPEVIELRRRFYPETDSYRMIGSSVTDFGWMDAVPESGPAMVVAEGLLPYLDGDQVRELLLRLHERFPGSELAFDALTTFVARRINRHPSIRKTGAEVKWGIDDPTEIERWGTGIRLLEEWSFTDSPDIDRLGAAHRLMFRVMGSFRSMKRSHRILRYRL